MRRSYSRNGSRRSTDINAELAGAVGRAAPARLLLVLAGRARQGAFSLATVIATMLLYLFAASFALIAIAKPFAPGQVGAWNTAAGWRVGVVATPPAGSADALGFWIVPG